MLTDTPEVEAAQPTPTSSRRPRWLGGRPSDAAGRAPARESANKWDTAGVHDPTRNTRRGMWAAIGSTVVAFFACLI